uniref:Ig-like domain-containing protein n=1 Tax=Sphenodon punctatus TaxID=8508 RepID=A0A8D0HM58_SPHPU
MGRLLWLTMLMNTFTPSIAILSLTVMQEIEGTWKDSTTLPCSYVPDEDFTQETVIWMIERDQSPTTLFRRDGSEDHVYLAVFRNRVSVPKSSQGNASLRIEKLEITDSGQYTCKVIWKAKNNSLISKERSITVRVIKVPVTKPIIKPGKAGLSVPRGARTNLTCSASGSPPITYQWFKGEPRQNSLVPVSSHAVLTFENPQISDAGTYYCEAENQVNGRNVQQSEVVYLMVKAVTDRITTTLREFRETEPTVGPVSKGRPIVLKALTTVRNVAVPMGHNNANKGHQRTGLPLYIIILIAVLCALLVFAVFAVIFCRRKANKDHIYEVTYHNSMNATRGEPCSGIDSGYVNEEAEAKAVNDYTEDPTKENPYEFVVTQPANEYDTLVKKMELEYEMGEN